MRWTSALTALGVAATIGCRDSVSPRAPAGTYALRSIRGEALPAQEFENAFVTSMIVADTLRLRADGTGTQRRIAIYVGGTASPQHVDATTELHYVVGNDRIEITFVCPPNASCVAGPHVIGTLTLSGFTVSWALGARVPQDFAAIDEGS